MVYLTSDGVTVPSRNSGNTKMTMQARNAAIIRKFVSIAIISRPEMPMMIYLPSSGIAAIQTAAISMRL